VCHKNQKHIWQNYDVKLTTHKIPNIAGYWRVLKGVNKFLMEKYKILYDYMEEGHPLFNEQEGIMVDEVHDACWAMRDHFMFCSDVQCKGQYEIIQLDEFYVRMMSCDQTEVGTEPKPVCIHKIRLDAFHATTNIKGKVQQMQEQVKVNPDVLFLDIVWIPEKIDKKLRNKDYASHCWNTTNHVQVMFIVHYLLVLLPKMYEIAQLCHLPMTNTYLFHTKC
jgi:hypothetical protein